MLFVLTGRGPETLHRLRRRQMTLEMLACACGENGMNMMLTSPTRIEPKSGLCRGWVLHAKSGRSPVWRANQAPLRNGVVYDAMYLADLKAHAYSYRRIVTALSRFEVPMFNPPLPPKDELYEWLRMDENLQTSSILPTTYLGLDADGIVNTMRESDGSSAFWFKPVRGSGGRNMLRIQPLSKGKYRVRGERFYQRDVKDTWSEQALRFHMQAAMATRSYLLQRDVSLVRTDDGRKADFRVTLARGHHGIWAVTALTARLARKGSALTNFHAGGSIEPISFQTGEMRDVIYRSLHLSDIEIGRIMNAAMRVAERISQGYPSVGILGIDVGLSPDGRVSVYDYNRRPGRDILTDEEIQLTMQQVARFGAYLLNKKQTL